MNCPFNTYNGLETSFEGTKNTEDYGVCDTQSTKEEHGGVKMLYIKKILLNLFKPTKVKNLLLQNSISESKIKLRILFLQHQQL